MKIGIFFGGQSREREISFAGGRTVFDNLNKSLFDAVPIFVDSIGNFILLNWQNIYKGTIRDFYPPAAYIPFSPNSFQVYIESLGEISREEQDRLINSVGKRIEPSSFHQYFDFAFLALHGPYGEDGAIQGILEWHQLPYSGSGILPSSIGINKITQGKLLEAAGFKRPNSIRISKKKWFSNADKEKLLFDLQQELGLPFVIKAPNQGSSIGITILSTLDLKAFVYAINKAFFIQQIEKPDWDVLSEVEKLAFIRTLTDIRDGIGMPVMADDRQINHPEELLQYINNHFGHTPHPIYLESIDNEEEILLESFIKGKEFSCIVIQNENRKPIALPPTEIIKGTNFFDYRSKYLPGMSRKITPINLPTNQIEEIRLQCEKLFTALSINVYARIDGFITSNGGIFLNDPNTTSGMLPSSFFFHQAAELGMNPSQFLTYIIRTSISERIFTGKKTYALKKLLNELDSDIERLNTTTTSKLKVGVIMGGFSSERHISVESGRNIYEKLASSTKYDPVPIFLSGNEDEHELFVIPVNVMLKDNADDIKEKVSQKEVKHPVINHICKEAKSIIEKYVHNPLIGSKRITYKELSTLVEVVFIALHGRPGEDGAVQAELEKLHIPYNGSGVESSMTTINKFETNKILRENGIPVANSMLVYKQEWEHFYIDLMHKIEEHFVYPFIAKPSDDGCSSAVKKINSREELVAYAKMMFGWDGITDSESSRILKLKFNEEFPQKNYFMVEDIIRKDGGKHFLEITGGLLTNYDENGTVHYELFEPSETLASGEVLSLEEKFLAGEGQNITPARFSLEDGSYWYISNQVKETLRRTAELLSIQGYARIDAFVRIYDNNKAETIIIEVNSLPGMTPATCIFHQTAINGYKPYDFIDRILSFGIARTKKSLS